jgi:hypothetical protein
MSQMMNQPEQKSGMYFRAKSLRRMISSALLIALLFVGATDSSRADQQTKPQSQDTVHSVVAKQAALVSEFEVNGLKVLLKFDRRGRSFHSRRDGEYQCGKRGHRNVDAQRRD